MDNWLLWEKSGNNSSIRIRKLDKEVGINVTEKHFDFPFSTSTESYVNRSQAISMIRSLIKFFKISLEELM